jgi:hypothetical protein
VKRSIIVCIAIVMTALFAPAKTAFADDPAPTKEQLDQAKKAFGEGKAFFDEGKLNEAIDKFKESYRLSRNPLLLYNIGFTLDQAGAKDKALFYYRKFLADAPKAATQRKEVEKRVEQIEKENLEADLAGTTTTTTTPTNTNNATTATKPHEEVKTAVTVKPAGTYSATDFQHQMIDAAPPGKPLDVTAFVPEDSGWTVTLYYRGNGDTKFFARTMRWRYKELVARIPAMKIGGSTIQYYIEVKDQTGNVVTRSGKSTSPNLINVDNTVAPRFYPDFTDEGEAPVQTAVQMKRHDEEDPLNSGGSSQVVDDEPSGGGGMVGGGVSETPAGGGSGFSDVGSSKFSKAKWISTGVAGAGVAAAMVGYILGKKQADNLVSDSQDCPMGASPPCRKFDLDYDKAVEDAGKRYNKIATVGAVVGVSAGVVAAYFWYRQLTAKKHGELKVSKSGASPETVWAITPSISDGFTGAAAAARF